VTDTITFEHPLNERCRTLLRLSHLFEQFDFHAPRESSWHSRAAISSLLEVAAILSRADIKSDLLKELDRYRASLTRISNKPGVDGKRLQTVLERIQGAEQELRNVQGQLGQTLRSDDFLTSIQQRSSIPGGSFDFDLPQLHCWLQRPHPERAAALGNWKQAVAPVQRAVDLSIFLIRSSATPLKETAANGLFQRTLDNQLPTQLLRISIPRATRLFAETSGSKHRFSIRFMSMGDDGHPKSVSHDVDFELTTCVI
jgi:cell division protein ZapD